MTSALAWYNADMVLNSDTKERALALARMGQGKVSTEAALGLRPGALRAEMKRDGAFAEAWTEAVEDASEAVEEALRARALEGDTTAATAYLKAKGAKEWKTDRGGQNGHNGPDLLVLATPEQLAELGQRLEQRRLSALPSHVLDVHSEETAP